MAKKSKSKTPSAPAVDRAAPCSPITDSVRKLEYENAVMKLAITDFCKAQEWACDEWKRQEHIARLFNLANDKLTDGGHKTL